MSSTFIVIGAPGQGKSEFVKEYLNGRYSEGKLPRCLVFDIQNEYGSRTKYPGQKAMNLSANVNDLRSRYTGDNLEQFQEICLRKRDTVCVFEEATMFFEGRTGKMTRKLIINRYHTGNVYMFLFHSINSVPPRIMEMCNYVVLHRTLDEEHTVYFKYSRLTKPFLELRDAPEPKYKIIKML